MTDQEYFAHIASSLKAVINGCSKYTEKNPNAMYTDHTGKERPISFAIDVARNHMKSIEKMANGDDNK